MSADSSASSSLSMSIPPRWSNTMRPFMQRADEFKSHEPAVAYFLRRYVVFTCMKDRPKDDHACTTFLTQLLTQLQAEAEALGPQSKDEFGKTLMNTFALKLFMRADEEERSNNVTLSTVRLFFTAAVLMEATAQFNKNEVMEPEIASKCKYAKYTAAKIKKALDAKVPYLSTNTQENEAGHTNCDVYTQAYNSSNNNSNNNSSNNNSSNNNSNSNTTNTNANNYAYDNLNLQLHPTAPPALPSESEGNDIPSLPPPPPPFAPEIDFTKNFFSNANNNNNNDNNNNNVTSTNISYNPPDNLFNMPNQDSTTQNKFGVITSDTGLQLSSPAAQLFNNNNSANQIPKMTMAQAAALRPARKPGGPSVEAMIDAQKFARQAVSALQFYDHENAVKQLQDALRSLGC